MPITEAQYATYLRNRGQYPKNWKKIVAEIRKRAGDQCECAGECGLHDGRDLFFTKAKRCEERNGAAGKWMRGMIMLTTAHLCHNPKCARRSHLKALCQRCHLRYDQELHARNSASTRMKKDF